MEMKQAPGREDLQEDAKVNRVKSPVVVALASALLTAGLVGGVAIAQTGPSVITACVEENSGNVRIVSSASDCKRSETSTSWNQQGPQGEPGTDGRDGVSGWIRVEGPRSSVPPGTYGTTFAECPEGTKVLGGGYVVEPDPSVVVYADYPGSANKWRVEVFNDHDTYHKDIGAFAICATAL